jgi:hypothetical protein
MKITKETMNRKQSLSQNHCNQENKCKKLRVQAILKSNNQGKISKIRSKYYNQRIHIIKWHPRLSIQHLIEDSKSLESHQDKSPRKLSDKNRQFQ